LMKPIIKEACNEFNPYLKVMNKMEPHEQSPCMGKAHGSQETPTRGEHPVSED